MLPDAESLTERPPLFARFARWVERQVGRSLTFVLAIAVVLAWAVSGPLFGWSDTWQLVINTGTTIVTFLMVCVIQNTQSRDTQAMQLKLDELIRVNETARKSLINLEEMSEVEVERMKAAFATLASDRNVDEPTARSWRGARSGRMRDSTGGCHRALFWMDADQPMKIARQSERVVPACRKFSLTGARQRDLVNFSSALVVPCRPPDDRKRTGSNWRSDARGSWRLSARSGAAWRARAVRSALAGSGGAQVCMGQSSVGAPAVRGWR
ncbi:MAG: low affinity iron permease family protein [Alphaproteobacteria bacterium]|nr:low affinity iron permease family protein [Alphaproteobacteria bacterium]